MEETYEKGDDYDNKQMKEMKNNRKWKLTRR